MKNSPRLNIFKTKFQLKFLFKKIILLILKRTFSQKYFKNLNDYF